MSPILFSFVGNNSTGVIGTYGVSKSDPSVIELTLNKDGTFAYKDLSNPNKQIDVVGKWKLDRNHVILEDHNCEYAFHDKWKVIDNGMRVKSRKGITYYYLGKL